MAKKTNSFTIIEMVVAFSLISTALFFLFSTLKNVVMLHHKMKKEIPSFAYQEKGFFLLKNIIRKIDVRNHPIDCKNEECSFYFIPEDALNLENDVYFAKCKVDEKNLVLELYKKEPLGYSLFQKTILLENLSFVNFTLEENPKTLFITFTTLNTPGYWTFFLDPYPLIE